MFNSFFKKSEFLIPIFFILSIVIIIVPVPTYFLDLLLSCSLAFSVMIFFVSLTLKEALSFPSFPSCLLYLALFRLGLNISSTRSMFLSGFSGNLIQVCGKILSSGNLCIGCLLLVLLFVVNFFVITKGAERIAEVKARFVLEALPGKQLALDADFSLGRISSQELERKRDLLVKESSFYSSMEGAFKFVKGDAIAGLIITFVNLIGALSLIACQTMDLETVFLFIIGDTLISQVPSLLTSLGAATLISRVIDDRSLSSQIMKDFSLQPMAFRAGIVSLATLMFFAKSLIITVLPLILVFIYFRYSSENIRKIGESKTYSTCQVAIESNNTVSLDLIEKHYIRAQEFLYERLGIMFPKPHLIFKQDLQDNSWNIKVLERKIFTGINSVKEDFFLTLADLLLPFSDELITFKVIEETLFSLKKSKEFSYEFSNIPSLSELVKLFKLLIKEGVSLRFFPKVIEILDLYSKKEMQTEELLLLVRKYLGYLVGSSVLYNHQVIDAITLDFAVEKMMKETSHSFQNTLYKKLLDQIEDMVLSNSNIRDCYPVLVTNSDVRLSIKRVIETKFPRIPVLAYTEISKDVEVRQLGEISDSILI